MGLRCGCSRSRRTRSRRRARRVRVASFAPLLREHGIESLDFRPAMSDAEYALVASAAAPPRKAAALAASVARSLLARDP